MRYVLTAKGQRVVDELKWQAALRLATTPNRSLLEVLAAELDEQLSIKAAAERRIKRIESWGDWVA